MGGGKAGREGGHRTHQHYDDDDDDDDDRSMFCSDFVASYRTMGKKIEIKLVAFVIIIISYIPCLK